MMTVVWRDAQKRRTRRRAVGAQAVPNQVRAFHWSVIIFGEPRVPASLPGPPDDPALLLVSDAS